VVPGLGKAVKANRKARMGRNPQTGEAIKIPAKTVVKFPPGEGVQRSGGTSQKEVAAIEADFSQGTEVTRVRFSARNGVFQYGERHN